MSPITLCKNPPTGAKFVIDYKLTTHRTVINSYTDNYLQEVLHNYILKGDRFRVVLIQHKNRPMTVVLRTYRQGDKNTVTDYIQIITLGDTVMTKTEIRNYLNLNKYMELNVV